MVVAERLGIPHATVLTMAAGSMVRPSLVAETLDKLRAEHGLPPDPELAMVSRSLVLSPIPPGFRDPAFPLPPTALEYRVPPTRDRVDRRRARRVGVTARRPHGDLRHARDGVQQRVGGPVRTPRRGPRRARRDQRADDRPGLRPGRAGRRPSRTSWWSGMSRSRRSCRSSTSSSRTVARARSSRRWTRGSRWCSIPMGADQPHNAERASALGIARVLDPVASTARRHHRRGERGPHRPVIRGRVPGAGAMRRPGSPVLKAAIDRLEALGGDQDL